jgi:uncharacterized protein DUF1236
MTISEQNSHTKSLVGALLLLAPLALVGVSGLATAQNLPSASLGETDPTAPLRLTRAERTAIFAAVRQDKGRPNTRMPLDSLVSVGVQLPPSIALRILPDTALAQAPAAKTVQYTVIENQVALVDPTNMRVVDIINQ